MNPAEWTDWETFKKAKAEYGNPKHIIIKRITRNLTNHTPSQKFVSIAKRIKFLLSFFNVTAEKFTDLIKETYKESEQTTTDEHIRQQDYIHNPLFKRLKYIQVLMFVFYIAMFVYFPLVGNIKMSGSALCNSELSPKLRIKCNHVNENSYIHLFFIVTSVYFILCALQIRFGESFLKN